jgi:hypothetical protein
MARQPSSLILQELFAQADRQFLDTLLTCTDARTLGALVTRWVADPRPWARETLLAFLDQPMVERPKALLVKRVYKHAEKAADDEIAGACMRGFDGLIRRRVVQRYLWVRGQGREIIDQLRAPSQRRTFSYPTSCYLRRRAWRYFRRKGFAGADGYVTAIAAALRQYRDADVALGQNMLDCWGLMHACFGKSDVIRFTRRHANLVPGRGLGELAVAPMFERHWVRPESFAPLMDLLLAARSRVVRVWSIQLLRRHHAAALPGIKPEQLLRILASDDADVQQFGAELLTNAANVEKLPLETWLQLLETKNFEALQLVCDAFMRHVAPGRISLAQAVEITCSAAVPVARLGWGLIQSREIDPAAGRSTLAKLADLRCEAVGENVARWALSLIGSAGAYEVDVVVRFFDSTLATVRRGALAWLAPEVPGYSDPALYARLVESPYDDVRLFLVGQLSLRQKLPGAGDDQLTRLWAGVLLNIHRGSRAKLTALRQISAAVRDRPVSRGRLLPVLAVAIRSVRGPEARHGLAALVAAVEASPDLAQAVAEQFPELRIIPVEQEVLA